MGLSPFGERGKLPQPRSGIASTEPTMPDAAAPATRTDLIRRAEIHFPTSDFDRDMRCFIGALGFRLDRIWPAEGPAFAAPSGHGTAILLERSANSAPVSFRLYRGGPEH